jgi:hypothetical protein
MAKTQFYDLSHSERPAMPGKELVCGVRNLDVSSRSVVSPKTSPEEASGLPQSSLGAEKRHVGDSHVRGLCDTVPLVARRQQRHEERVYASIQPVDKPLHGCLDIGLGGACRRDSAVRSLDLRGTRSTHQQLGDVGCDKDCRPFGRSPQRPTSVVIHRQHDCSLLH